MTMTSHQSDALRADPSVTTQRCTPWRVVGAGAGLIGIEGIAGYLHPALAEVLVATDVIVLVSITLIVLAAILFGSTETVERVFRLLRWAVNRPEPAAPAPPGPGSDRGAASV